MKKLLLIIFYFFLFSNSSSALIEVDITRGNLEPLPIAISPLYIEPGSKDIKQGEKIIKNVGEEISKVIEINFKRSGLFNPLKKDSFVQNPDIAHAKPRFEDWKLIKAQALVTGKVTVSDDKLRAEFRLWDVVAAKEMIALAGEADIMSAKGYQELGDIEVIRGNLSEARIYYEKALKLTDPNGIARQTLDELPEKDELSTTSLQSTEVFIEPSEALNRKGEIFAHYKMHERAISMYSLALRIKPNPTNVATMEDPP